MNSKLVCFLGFIYLCAAYDWTIVDKVLTAAIQNHAFPGCVALVANNEGILYISAHGNFTYGLPPPYNSVNPPTTISTIFDLASVSKVLGVTTSIAQFYQRGELSLETPIYAFLGDEYKQNGKQDITVLNCLLHNTGYPPDPSPNYWDPAFGCPQTSNYHPQEDFSCQEQIFNSLLSQTLAYPTGTKYVYSDLSMITLMYVVGYLAYEYNYVEMADVRKDCIQNISSLATTQCFFEAYVRKYVLDPLDMQNTGYLPTKGAWPHCAPTWNDTSYQHTVMQGHVSDGNAYALGGIAGHAGLFSTVLDMYSFMSRLLFAAPNDTFLNSSTVSFFTTEFNHSQSSRALGWNTNDPNVFDYGWNQSCGAMSSKTFTHIGFTGTQVCADPQRNLITILLTNRVYPDETNCKIALVRQQFNTAVVHIVDGTPFTEADIFNMPSGC